MSMFTVPISCLASSNLPWFIDLTFQVPMQIALSALDFISVTSHIHSWTWLLLWLWLIFLSGVIFLLITSSILCTYQPREFIFQFPIILPFILFMGFSSQEYWNDLPFLSPVDHIFSELSIMTHPSWMALHSMAQSFLHLPKTVDIVIILVSFLWLLSFLWFFPLPWIIHHRINKMNELNKWIIMHHEKCSNICTYCNSSEEYGEWEV